MGSNKKLRPDLIPVPMLLHKSVYVGIDVGKAKHVAGFVSTTLLEHYQRFEACPTLVLWNSREGFRTLIDLDPFSWFSVISWAGWAYCNPSLFCSPLPEQIQIVPNPADEVFAQEMTENPKIGSTPVYRH